MIQIRSRLTVLDTSGVREVRNFDIPGRKGGNRASPGRIGDKIVGAVYRMRPGQPDTLTLRKGDVVRGILVTSKKGMPRSNGTTVRFPDNGVILLNAKGEPLAIRIRGALPMDLRKMGHAKLLLMADHIV